MNVIQDFILQISRENAYNNYAALIGRDVADLTIQEKNIAISQRVIATGAQMLESCVKGEYDTRPGPAVKHWQFD